MDDRLRTHPATLGDAQRIADLCQACDLEEFGEIDYSKETLLEDWEEYRLDTDVWIVTDDGDRVVGYGNIRDIKHGRFDAWGVVHPEYRGRGIGSHLLHMHEARAHEYAAAAESGVRVVLRNHTNGLHPPSVALFEGAGYTAVRCFWRMQIEMAGPPPETALPDGVTARRFVPGQDERQAYEVNQATFEDHYGFVPQTYEEWAKRMESSRYDPTLWFFFMHEGKAVGISFCGYYLDMGWVSQLGVRREWRRRGLGQAILQYTFGEFYRRGRNKVALGVDSESLTGATRLYERAGMHVVRQFVRYEKEIRA